jgi:hypothetical protein
MKPYTPPSSKARRVAINDIHHRTADQPRASTKPYAKAMRHAARQQGAKDAADGAHEAYTLSRIAKELDDTALGKAYYGNALRVAKDIPGVTAEERALLDRYATGAQRGTDHVGLQDLAIKLRIREQ